MEHTALHTSNPSRETNRTAVVFAVLHAAFFIASLAVIPVLAPSARIPNPFGPDEPSRRFFLDNAFAIRWSDWLQLASAVCLAALGCVWFEPHQQSECSTHSNRNLIVAGSLSSAAFLMLSAITSWALASPGTTDPGAAFRSLQFLPFLFGGPGWSAFFALFLFGASRSGVGHLPRWMVRTGYGLSVTAVLATLVLIALTAAPFLPLTRFLSFVWLIVATTLLRKVPARS